MLKNLKYADFIKINNFIHMVKNIEFLSDDCYKIILKDMSNGSLREEILNNYLIEKLNIKKCKLLFLEKDDSYYYFKDSETNEQYKYTIPFIGSDINCIIGELYKDFEKKVRPVMCNINPNNIVLNTEIILNCNTEGAIIYYTLDGTEPTEKSLKYEKPIIIKNNILIRAVAYKDGYTHSIISDFDFHLKSRKIKIFLSPSRQDYNKGIDGSKYTTEYKEMNLICDELQNILEKYDCILYRNNYDTFIEDWSLINRNENIDCHLAIHSNATTGHWKKGVENWIHDEYSETYSLAIMIYNNLYNIYYDNENILTNRGVKYAKGRIAEASPAYFKFGINLEVAYHDNLEDANWIVNNRKEIANAISSALIKYYQLELK